MYASFIPIKKNFQVLNDHVRAKNYRQRLRVIQVSFTIFYYKFIMISI